MNRARFTLALVAAATAPAVAAPTQGAQNNRTIGQILAANPDFSRFTALAQQTDLADRFNGQSGPFTVFVPVNAGFASLGAGFGPDSPKPDAGQIRAVLMYHVVDQQIALNEFKAGTLRSASGVRLFITLGNGFVYVNGTALGTPINASNGIIYPIGNVLIPNQINEK